MDGASSLENEQIIIQWLQQNTIPIQHIEAGNGFADLQPLKALLEGTKIVGLGETTHGTHEFLQLRLRLAEFLVTEMGYTVFTIEGSFAAWQPINDYVLEGKGDRATVLTGQNYVVWDTEEMTALLDWMRTYNQTVPAEKKVRFYGLDINCNAYGRKAVLDYLRKFNPDRLAATAALFDSIAAEEAKWPRRIDEQAEKNLIQLMPHLQDLIDYLIANKDTLVSRSSVDEFDLVVQYARVMKQWVMAYAPELLPSSQSRADARSISMAENLMYWVDKMPPDTRFIVLEHNWHVSLENIRSGEPNMGYHLRQKYGQAYRAFAVEFNQGSFNTRLNSPENFLGDLKLVTIPPAVVGSLSWYLARLNKDVFILNLHAPADNPAVEQWLVTPQKFHQIGWVYDEEENFNLEAKITKDFDGIIFIDRTTATHPTANALKSIAKREGL